MGRNFDAFNDVVRGGFGTPHGGFKLRWINSAHSRAALAYDAVAAELERARRGEGQTIFDICSRSSAVTVQEETKPRTVWSSNSGSLAATWPVGAAPTGQG